MSLSKWWARLLYPQTMWVLIGLTGFVLSTAVVVRLPATLAFDLAVTKRLQYVNTPLLNRMARWSTFAGNSLTLILATVVALPILWWQQLFAAALILPMALFSLLINMLLKKLVNRHRPGEAEVRVELHLPRWGFSFPSGHSMGSAATYWFLAFLGYLHLPSPAFKWALLPVLLVLPLLVGASRIYVGAHWFSDVVAGWAAGLLVVVMLAALYPV